MIAASLASDLADPVLQRIVLGLGLIGALAGLLGTFAVVRRQSLVGDAVSHAALPGVAIVVLLGGRSPLWVVVGGGLAGWIAIRLVTSISSKSRVPYDSALAGVLAVFFGFGLALMTYAQKLAGREPHGAFEAWLKPHAAAGQQLGLDRALFGQSAFLTDGNVLLFAIAFLAVSAIVVAFWRAFHVLSFDPAFAASLGWPTTWLERLLSTLIVASVVLGMNAIGVVLMSALLIAPATAARFWCRGLKSMAAMSCTIGAVSGAIGAVVSHTLSSEGRSVPTGPSVVLIASAFALLSMLLAAAVQYRHSRPSVTP